MYLDADWVFEMITNDDQTLCSTLWEYLKILKSYIATLALGLRPKQGLVKVWAKCEGRESHFMLPGVEESVRE
jgi:hypothetical protein